MKEHPRYLIVTPVRDEARYIEKMVSAVTGQTQIPAKWVIVDDGSTDGTSQILDELAANISWITVVHRENRGYRSAGGGVVEAFYEGYSPYSRAEWDFIVKLDGDLSFSRDYFEQCFLKFEAEPRLGIGGGTVYSWESGSLKIDSVGDPPFHVRGATKIYRRACWEQIEPLVKAPGWDTIDEVRANLHGWQTRTFPDLKIVQHKPTGAADGAWRNAFKNGLANYVTGYHPIFMLAKCLKRAVRRPDLVESAALFCGFFSGYLKRVPQLAGEDAIRYLRRQQLRRLFLRPSIYS